LNAFSKSCGQGLSEVHLAGFNEDSAAMSRSHCSRCSGAIAVAAM
jgi:hypothetical protein